MSGTGGICKAMGVSLLGGAIGAGIGAAAQAAVGAVGAAVLKHSGYSGYNPTEAASMGAVGGAIVGGSLAALVSCCGVFAGNGKAATATATSASTGSALVMAATSVLLGMVGYGVLNSQGNSTEMGLGQTCASFGVGTGVFTIPLLLCCMCTASCVAGGVAIKTSSPRV